MINPMNAPVAANTSDKLIRLTLRDTLATTHKGEHYTVIEELGLAHGTARVDMVVVNGLIHGYELKSDLDTLQRLPEQMKVYNSVLDRMTLVVGKKHLHDAIKLVPDWWGITIAKMPGRNGEVSLLVLREAQNNPDKDSLAIAQLLWRNEALSILEELESADGFRSKSRDVIYRKLVEAIDQQSLCDRVRDRLFNRQGWRSGKPL
jgi:hypothetical protein